MRTRNRLLSWYRVVPLCIVAVFGLISFAYSFGPSMLFKALYPLEYEDAITESASSHGVDPYLVAAVIRSESSWDANAASSRGAQGLMQLMPQTAADMVEKGLVDGSRYSSDNLLDPETNIEFGCAYLSYLLSYFNGATEKAIAAYNAGLGNVDSWTQDEGLLHNAITFPETQAYLVRVTMARTRYAELYPQAFM
jgi:soluble lytic murein transglycosylase